MWGSRTVRTVRLLSQESTPVPDSTTVRPPSYTSPRPVIRQPTSYINLTQQPIRPRITGSDSSDMDRISYAPLPIGKPVPEPPVPQPPPAKKLKPTVPTPSPLPSGPPTVQTLRVLLEPEHINLNRPKRFFDYVRSRDTKPALLTLSPPDLQEILVKMKNVDDIWLRTMGEDDGNLQCLAKWLRSFINNPKAFEGCVIPLLWVGSTLSNPISSQNPLSKSCPCVVSPATRLNRHS